MAKLIGYLRQPGNRTTGRLHSLDEQREAITAWARKKRHRVAAFVEDPPGASLGDRPGLAEAMLALGDEGIDGLVVAQLASLDDDLVTQEQLLAEIRRTGARVFALSQEEAGALGAKPPDSSRSLVREVLTTAAANEASIAVLRSASRLATGGSPAYGYRVEDGQLVPDADEQAALARIAELRAMGATLRQIARTLDAEGHRPRRAQRWHPEALRRIVQRTQA
jgi:DNA invertase Pin-like site-specific DNA recombinase